jgi:hypothetical protein
MMPQTGNKGGSSVPSDWGSMTSAQAKKRAMSGGIRSNPEVWSVIGDAVPRLTVRWILEHSALQSTYDLIFQNSAEARPLGYANSIVSSLAGNEKATELAPISTKFGLSKLLPVQVARRQ